MLDFRNETEQIVEAFEQFHGWIVAPPTDPNILTDTRRRLDDFDVLRPEEIEAAMPALLGAGASDDKRSAETYAALAPAKHRFERMGYDERLAFRDALTRFVRTYSFVHFGLFQLVTVTPTVTPDSSRTGRQAEAQT